MRKFPASLPWGVVLANSSFQIVRVTNVEPPNRILKDVGEKHTWNSGRPKIGSPGWIRTINPVINSHMLYR